MAEEKKSVEHENKENKPAQVLEARVNKKASMLNKQIVPYILSVVLLILLVASVITHGFSFPSQSAADTALNFVNKYMLEPQGAHATLTAVSEESGLIALNVSIEGRNYKIYTTKDGKILILQPIDMEAFAKQYEEMMNPTPQSIPKTDKPKVEFYVMSFCPYGQQAVKSLKEVYNLLKDKVTFEPHYVIYSNYQGGSSDYCVANGTLCSMHGINELREDMRQLCIYKNYGIEKYMAYTTGIISTCSLANIETCWKDVATKNGISTADVEACVAKDGESLVKSEYDLNKEKGVEGSPTIFMNGQAYTGDRSPENFKTAICTGFVTAPSECSKNITSSTSAPSGSCG